MELGEPLLHIYKAQMEKLGLYKCKCYKKCSGKKKNLTLEKAPGLLMIIDSYSRK